MRLLWIPHTYLGNRVGHRSKYLIDRLKHRHDVHIVTWSEPAAPSVRAFLSPEVHLKALIPWTRRADGVTVHHVPRFCLHRLPTLWKQNERLLQNLVRKLVQENEIETVIFGPSSYLIGYPPTDTGATLVFDYVDHTPDQHLGEYLERADEVVCASQSLRRQIETLGRSATYIPNGIDRERLRRASGKRVRELYDLGDGMVISLIGLTCAPDFYFAKSLLRIKNEIPSSRFLFVGKGPLHKPLRGALRKLKDSSIWTGWIPQERIYDFFLATDIGLYPGGEDEYFRAACPIKLLEYAAAGRPAVSSRVDEVSALGLKNVIQVDATEQGFYEGIKDARNLEVEVEVETVPSWTDSAMRLEKVLT